MPGTRTPLNGLTKKCSSEHRRGRGTLQRKVGKRLPQGPHERRGGAAARCRRHRSSGDARRRHRRMARLASPHQRTGAVAGLCNAKSESDSRRGPHERRGGASARCRRHRSSGDARRRHRRSRLAPERGCHEVTGVEKARLRSKRRGSGICPVKKARPSRGGPFRISLWLIICSSQGSARD